MRIDKGQIQRLNISEVDELPPLTVITENFAPGKGKIIIQLDGDTWSSYWPAMGGRTVEQFFIDIDNDYAIKNLCWALSDTANDEQASIAMIKRQIIKLRRQQEITRAQADEFWQAADSLNFDDEFCWYCEHCRILFGCELYDMDWPQRPNPHYQYMEKVCSTVRQALIACH
ncbi:MAG: hypothetical protein LPH21_11580 [Shewanella sp.]|nr:hypothetical protein [Shewanella sp.]